MKRSVVRHVGLVVCLGLFTISPFPSAVLAQSCEQPVATAVSVQGIVESRRMGTTQWQPVHLHDTYCPGDEIRVQERSRADITLLNHSVLRLGANTSMIFEGLKERQTSVVNLIEGLVHFFSRRPRRLEVNTPNTVAGVRGTEFFIRVDDEKTFLTIFEGQVLASNVAGSLPLSGGQSAVAEAGNAPVRRMVARPRDALHWALYYPPVIYAQPDALKAGVEWERKVGTSFEFYLQGDVQKAFDAIANVPDDIREPRFFTYRAALLLAVGRVAEAHADIQRALSLHPNDSHALALQTIMAIVQNEKEQAFRLAQQAVEADANSATAQIVLSYAQQARFDLAGARTSLVKAVQLEPDNALAWARLAELHASFGDLGKALKAANQAVALEPSLARTQTVLGFTHLTRVETEKAKAAFDQAIVLDQADPLPRLGLGLAIIRDGDVTVGSRQIEIAASLDPNNALIRSYLGKAYFEEKRGPLDEREFDIAKQLDPNDPTPWFYSAIAKQSTNRPVEALQDMQKAIELNDNRAVYRSRLLLDSDLAARSASQARIYSDLGFQQLALVKGWTSVNTDPTNYSAHRFLADSYGVLPRHEIARVSELLQSQLLQPINLTPIQPRLAESTQISTSGGPGSLSFNEFNPLFNRNGVTLQVNGILGENDTYAGEGVLGGIAGIASYSIGYSHFETDGVRVNDDIEDDIFNAFVQIALSHKTSIQAEFRHRKFDQGDIQTRFLPDDVSRTLRLERQQDLIRLGARHALSPNNVLIANLQYVKLDENTIDPAFPAFNVGVGALTQLQPADAFSGELQHLFRSRYFNLTSGVGYFDVDAEIDINFKGFIPPPGPGEFEISISGDNSIRHFNAYAYAQIKLIKNMVFTIGGSYDKLSGKEDVIPEGGDLDQFNPKFGLIWNPFSSTTIRGAVFRILKRTLVTDQTLEPTQVAGFNQFFDDFDFTKGWHYGVAFDQKITDALFVGAAFSKRELELPVIAGTAEEGFSTSEFDSVEYDVRSYINWVPHPYIALRAGYAFEKFENDEAFAFGRTPIDLKTHRVPFGVNFYHPTGWSAGLSAMYVDQEGTFLPQGSVESQTGSDQFWLANASIGYRLPKRYGFISLGVDNITDRKFNYFEVDRNNRTLNPGRTIMARFTLAYP